MLAEVISVEQLLADDSAEPFEHHCPVCGCGWEFCRCTVDDLLDSKYEHEVTKEVAWILPNF